MRISIKKLCQGKGIVESPRCRLQDTNKENCIRYIELFEAYLQQRQCSQAFSIGVGNN